LIYKKEFKYTNFKWEAVKAEADKKCKGTPNGVPKIKEDHTDMFRMYS